jgi:hypothetical protein
LAGPISGGPVGPTDAALNTDSIVKDPHVELLEKIVERKQITVETWASDHKFGRTSVFDWKARRSAGTSLKGKVSDEKAAAIESAIREDAAALGVSIRTLNSD